MRRRRAAIVAIGVTCALAAMQAAPTPARATDPFTPGTGLATATAINPVIAAGNLQISVVAGQATASYRDRTAAGISALFDIPLLRSVSGTEVCGTTPQGIALPAPLVADTGPNGDKEPVAVANAANGAGLEQEAAAEPGAHATSTAGVGTFALPPVATITGGETTAETRADESTQTRTAAAHTTLGAVTLLGGLVTLKGLEWDVTQSMQGPDSRARVASVQRSFHLGAIAIGLPGLPLVELPIPSADQLAPVVTQANALLGTLGVQLRLPVDDTNADAGIEGVTPLTIAIGGKDFLASPLLAALFTSKEFQQLTLAVLHTAFDPTSCNQLFGLMKGLGPEFNATYNQFGALGPLLLAVVTGALGGTGEIQLNVGGVSTRLDDTYYAPPDFRPAAPGVAQPGAAGTAGTPGTPSHPGASTTNAVAAPSAPATASITDAAPVASTACKSTSPAGKPGCWLGQAPAGAIAAILFTVALLALDELYRRRRAASSKPPEVAA